MAFLSAFDFSCTREPRCCEHVAKPSSLHLSHVLTLMHPLHLRVRIWSVSARAGGPAAAVAVRPDSCIDCTYCIFTPVDLRSMGGAPGCTCSSFSPCANSFGSSKTSAWPSICKHDAEISLVSLTPFFGHEGLILDFQSSLLGCLDQP